MAFIGAVGAVVGYGLWAIEGITHHDITGDPRYYLTRQIVFALVGSVGLVVALVIDPEVYRTRWRLIFGGTASVIALVLLTGPIRGSKRWLDLGFFRIGSEGYAEENQSYGLATMRKEHVRVDGDVVIFDYAAKGGKRRIQSVVDPEVHDVVRALNRRRGGGRELLAYREGRRWVDVKSADINAYIKEVTGGEFTAKDFRTWTATVLAAVALAVSSEARSTAARKRAVTRAMREVAHYLGNTPAVCRSSYVDPRLVDRYAEGATIAAVLGKLGAGAEFGQPSTQGTVELAVLDLLADEDIELEKVA